MKLFSLFFSFLRMALSLNAQTQPEQLWQSVEYVKYINVKSPSITLDKFQNTYMLTNQTDESPFSGFTLVKYDTTGNVLWKKHSQPGFIGILYGSFTVDSIGNAYVGLWYDGGLPGYDADAVIQKYAPDGTKLWEYNYGLDQTGDSYIYFSEIDTLNGRLITLGMNLNDTVAERNFLFIQSVDTSDGGIIWKTKIPGVFRPQNIRIQSNHIQLLSTQYKTDSKYYVNTLVDFEGNILAQYEKPYSGYEIDYNYISKTGDVIFGNKAFGYNVTRVDVKGDTLWTYTHPLNSGTNKNWVRGLIEDTLLNVYVTGSIELPGLDLEMVTSKIKNNGELDWEDIFHPAVGEFGDGGNKATLDNGRLVISGFIQIENLDLAGIIKIYEINNGALEDDIIISSENIFTIENAFISKEKLFYTSIGYNGQTATNNITAITGCFNLPHISPIKEVPYINTISIFPNPTKEYICISDIDTHAFKEISIFDMNGKIIFNKIIENSEEKVSFNTTPPGTYTVCVHGNNLLISKKVIKK